MSEVRNVDWIIGGSGEDGDSLELIFHSLFFLALWL